MLRTTNAIFGLALWLVLADPGAARANLILYGWDDDHTGSAFFGSFTVNTDLLANAGGGNKLLTFSGITSSFFGFGRELYTQPPSDVYFPIADVSTGGVVIDPGTGAVLTDGSVFFGPSTHVVDQFGRDASSSGGYANFDTKYNVSDFGGPGGGETAYLYANWMAPPYPRLASHGHWEVQVTPTPAPSSAALAAVGTSCGLLFWLARWGLGLRRPAPVSPFAAARNT